MARDFILCLAFGLCELLSIRNLSILGFLICLANPVCPAASEIAAAAANSPESLHEHLAGFLAQPRFASAEWGVKVVSLRTRQTLFEHRSQKLMKPASNAKLYTCALALDRFGPDFRIKTSLYASAKPDASGVLKSDLIAYGRGDPSFAARFNGGDYAKSLEPLVDALIAAGIKRIEGDLVGDETFFRGPPMGSGWTWDDLQYYYGAEVSALTVEDNVLDLVFRPGAHLGDPCEVTVKPATQYVAFLNRTKTASNGSPRSIEIFRPIGENTAYLTGQLPLDGSNHIGAVSVCKPALFYVSLFRDAMARRGISVSGGLRSVGWLDSDTASLERGKRVEIASVESRPLREILGRMMKPSQNLYAQLLLLQVGAASDTANQRIGGSGIDEGLQTRRQRASPPPALSRDKTTEELGIAELKRLLAKAGVPANEVLLNEGSGLSRSCLVTPNATVELLRFMHGHRDYAIFSEALPLAGVDGSLRNRMKGTKAASNVRAKTGHIGYVDTLAGYVTSASGEPLVFSAMLNNYSNPARSGREEVDAVAVILADYGGRSRD